MKTNTPQFLLIDDDVVNNFISRTIIKKTLGEIPITEFTQPELGFQFLKDYNGGDIIVLLDINMPIMTGWDLLEKFNELTTAHIQCFKIFILTSSINPHDVEQADKNPHVIDLIQKPFSKEKLLKAMEKEFF